MNGSPKVIAHLQKLINGELAARDQYMAHSRKFKDWGLYKLHKRLNHEMSEEVDHADALIERMLFLGAEPDFNQQDKAHVGRDIKEMLQNDLAVEYEVSDALKEAMAVCESEQDYQTRDILLRLLEDTEMDHALWLEQQLRLIEMVGMANYVQAQMQDESGEA